MQVFISSSEHFHYYSREEIRVIMTEILSHFDKDTVIITGGGGGCANAAAETAIKAGFKVCHALQSNCELIRSTGIVNGSFIKKESRGTMDWMAKTLRPVDMLIMFEGHEQAFEEALYAEKHGAYLVLFPESSYHNYALACAKADDERSEYRICPASVNIDEIDRLLDVYKAKTDEKEKYKLLLEPRMDIQIELMKQWQHKPQEEESQDTQDLEHQEEKTSESKKRKRAADSQTVE